MITTWRILWIPTPVGAGATVAVVVVVEVPVVVPDVDSGAPAVLDPPPQPARSSPAATRPASHRPGPTSRSRIGPVKTGATFRQTSVDRDRTRPGDAKRPKRSVRHGLVKAVFAFAALGWEMVGLAVDRVGGGLGRCASATAVPATVGAAQPGNHPG